MALAGVSTSKNKVKEQQPVCDDAMLLAVCDNTDCI